MEQIIDIIHHFVGAALVLSAPLVFYGFCAIIDRVFDFKQERENHE
jgi:hypothetical protein